ncbi:MAG: sigma-54-dependent Fis family transcriptional regulator [Deltaproteobacteria bacterium]|nr:MAG: sigma-54-dependent Fis family transcriptional regulator [Deltaproteobacteria bacterium]
MGCSVTADGGTLPPGCVISPVVPVIDDSAPWPRVRNVINALVSGLRNGRFIEEALESVCVELGASSAWSTLETKGHGPLHRSRTASFQGASPAVLAMHVTQVLERVQDERVTTAGRVPYAEVGSYVAVPLWSEPDVSAKTREFVGAMYLEFPGDQGTQAEILAFVEAVAALLGGMISQQTRIETTSEDLLVERATDRHESYLELDQLLAPESMRGIREELRAAMQSGASIMILGESGTGKTQLGTAFARATHQEPIVRATLGMADDLNTITSELFGHERGAFSGAVSKRKGLVEHADGGTLILDEVLNLPSNAQKLLLDFTQFGLYRPLGYQGREPKTAKVRLISVTNGDVQQAIKDRGFRQDLYYRLATVPIVLPPLRDRRQDIPKIATLYLHHVDSQTGWELSPDALDVLTSPHLPWEGNIRELEAVLERARNRARVSDGSDPVIDARHFDLPADTSPPPAASPDSYEGGDIATRWEQILQTRDSLEASERAIIEETLAACEGFVARAARVLSMSRTGLISRMATLQIEADEFRRRRRQS